MLKSSTGGSWVGLGGCLLVLCSCATEVASLTSVPAQLEFGVGLAPVQFSHLARDGESAPVDELEIRFDGQPINLSSGGPLVVNNREFMISMYMPATTGRFEFLRDGQLLLTSEPVELDADRFNYLIVYGELDAPDLALLASAREARRLNVANLHADHSDLEVTLLDEAYEPLATGIVLEYGEAWSHLPDEQARSIGVAVGDSATSMQIGCNRNIAVVVTTSGPDWMPFLAPTQPESADADAAQCFEPSCDCP